MSKNVRAEYLPHIINYKKSGLSIRKYCELHDLKEHKFIYYRGCELKKSKPQQSTSKFAQVVVEPEPQSSPPTKDHGYYVDPVWLAQFVDKLLSSR